jgi:eukaryotic-like serine/threonine-protein kinase
MNRDRDRDKDVDTPCPTSEELRQLLDWSLSGEQQEQVTQHLDACACCQTKLEAMATEGSNISQAVEHLDNPEPMPTSAYWPALNSLSAGGGQAVLAKTTVKTAARTTDRARRRALDFLDPPGDPAFLGRLAQFDVMRVLGEGGMGIVVEAFDSRLQRSVALKVLDPDLAGDEIARQRFCREARAAASITHENVVAVHQVEKASEDGLPFLVMQLVPGESLEQRLRRVTQLPLREVVRIGMQASQGLAAAHAQGLIHRDIKPGNMLLEEPSDRVKLTDFGLARVADEMKLTRTGFVSGTPLYMAPEQALGGEADTRSDLFSLGAVLYEMCAGQPPFSGSSAPVILKQIVEARQRPLRELNPAVPEWLSVTIDRLLAKKPADRIQSAAHLAELFEFEWALMKTNSDDVPTVCEEEQRRRVTRSRRITVAAAVTTLAVGLLGGVFLGRLGRSVAPSGPAAVSSAEPLAVLSANEGAVTSVSFSPASPMLAMAIEDGSVRLWDLSARSVRYTMSAARGGGWSSQFSRRGDLLATAGDDGAIKLWKPSQSEPLRSFEHSSAVRGLAFSGDDQTLYAGDCAGMLRAWPVTGGRPTAEARQPGAIFAVAISPRGDMLATGGTDKVVRLWNAKTLTQKLLLEGFVGPVNSLSFDAAGQRLASVGWDKTVRIWDVGSGQLVKSWQGHEGELGAVAYSPSAKKLATGGSDGAVKLWNAESGELLATYLGHPSPIQTIAFSPDGSQLASGGRDGAVRVWKME